MKITKQARREARQLFRACRVNGLLDEGRVRQSVSLLVQQKPRGFLAVLEQLHRLVKLDVVLRSARAESAAPLTEQFQAQLGADLAKIYGPGLNLEFAVNPELLGGMRVQVGRDVYDGSVQARLNALKETF